MAMNEKGLGQRLQEARQAAGLTQQQLCQKANLSFSTLTKIERGAIKSPSIFTIQSIAGALGTSLDELVGSTGGGERNLRVTKSGVKFIFFDVNGCLVHFYHRAFSSLAQDIDVPADVIETAFWHYNDEVCRGTLSMTDFNNRLAERLGVPSVDWSKYYLETVEPIQEMQELLTWAAEHYKVGLLTNIMPGLLSSMQNLGTLPRLSYDAVIDSSAVGAIKPEQQIFEIAQSQTGCSPSEIMLIDDSRANVMAAERFGWHVLWFDYARPVESVANVREALAFAE
jgi:FMN phosphatase YigB (HAD superfamily)/DNA-binding XRE family transcriptional regulator